MADVGKLVEIRHRANANERAIAFHHRRGKEIILGVLPVLTPGRAALEFPNQLAGLSFESVQVAITAGKDDLRFPLDIRAGDVGPLTLDDVFSRQIAPPD